MEQPAPEGLHPREGSAWQFRKNCCLWEEPILEKSWGDCLLWKGPHAGAGQEREEEGAAERTPDELSATPILCTPVPLKGGGGEFGNENEHRKKGLVYFGIRFYFSLL